MKNHLKTFVILILAAQLTCSAAAEAASKRSFWEKFWCGDLTTSQATREKRLSDKIETLRASSSSFSDSLHWELVQLDQLEQYVGTMKSAIEAGLVLARNAETPELAQVFRQKWSQIYRFSVQIEDFEKGAEHVIKKRTALAARDPRSTFDPKKVEDLKLLYRYQQAFLADYPMQLTSIPKSLYYDVNDLAFQAELAEIQKSIVFDINFKGVLSVTDGIPNENRFASTMKFFGRTSMQNPPPADWAQERLRQWGVYLNQLRGSTPEKQALLAFRAVNYEAMKYMYFGIMSTRDLEMNLKTYASLIDGLTTFVKSHSLKKSNELLELIQITDQMGKSLEHFWAYLPEADSKYRERILALNQTLQKAGL